MNIPVLITVIKIIGLISIVLFLNNVRWLLISLRLRKKFMDNADNRQKNISIENDVTILFNKSHVNMIDRRNGMLVSKELHEHRYGDLLILFDKSVSYFAYRMRHPLYWLLLTSRFFEKYPPAVTYFTSLFLWLIGYLATRYLDTSGYGQIILDRLLSLFPA